MLILPQFFSLSLPLLAPLPALSHCLHFHKAGVSSVESLSFNRFCLTTRSALDSPILRIAYGVFVLAFANRNLSSHFACQF